jgi:hypothetical protein
VEDDEEGWRCEAKRIVMVIKPFNPTGIRVRERGEVWCVLTRRLSRRGSCYKIQDGDAIVFRGRTRRKAIISRGRVRVKRLPSSCNIPSRPSFGFSPRLGHGAG